MMFAVDGRIIGDYCLASDCSRYVIRLAIIVLDSSSLLFGIVYINYAFSIIVCPMLCMDRI